MNRDNMYEYFRQTKEFIFLDEVMVYPGEYAVGKKYISEEEWYFKYHFPNNPMMPGVFQMEAMMQTGGLIVNTLPGKKEASILFDSAKNIRILSMVRPNNIITTNVRLISYKRGIMKLEGQVELKDKIISKMDFSLILPNELPKISL